MEIGKYFIPPSYISVAEQASTDLRAKVTELVWLEVVSNIFSEVNNQMSAVEDVMRDKFQYHA